MRGDLGFQVFEFGGQLQLLLLIFEVLLDEIIFKIFRHCHQCEGEHILRDVAEKKIHPIATKWKVSKIPLMLKIDCLVGVVVQAAALDLVISLQRLWMNKPSPCHKPQRVKFHVTPCQKPISSMVAT